MFLFLALWIIFLFSNFCAFASLEYELVCKLHANSRTTVISEWPGNSEPLSIFTLDNLEDLDLIPNGVYNLYTTEFFQIDNSVLGRIQGFSQMNIMETVLYFLEVSPNLIFDLDTNQFEYAQPDALKEIIDNRNYLIELQSFKNYSEQRAGIKLDQMYIFSRYVTIKCSNNSVQNVSATVIWTQGYLDNQTSNVFPLTFPESNLQSSINLEYSYKYSMFKNLVSLQQEGKLNIRDDYGDEICNFTKEILEIEFLVSYQLEI